MIKIFQKSCYRELLISDHWIIFFSATPSPQPQQNPCVPSPCGANAICRETYNTASCSCAPDFFGNPYEGCRPECVVDSDCSADRACVRSKCTNPCPGTCGQNAMCQVVNHLPTCSCLTGYTGDPFQYCRPAEQIRKSHRHLNNFPFINYHNSQDLFPPQQQK